MRGTFSYRFVVPATISALACLLLAVSAVSQASASKPFGIEKFSLYATERTVEKEAPEIKERQGVEIINEPYTTPFTEAGGHPWALTAAGEISSEEANSGSGFLVPTEDPKDVVVSIPTGMVGNPTALPRCSLTVVTSGGQCPYATQVGVYHIEYQAGKEFLGPIVNVTPEKGQSAEFALENTAKIVTPILTAHLVRVREPTSTGERELYGLDVVSNQIARIGLRRFETTFWGVPADPSHDRMRGLFCRRSSPEGEPLVCPAEGTPEGGGHPAGVAEVPFLSWPTDCSAGPETATIRADSWQNPGSIVSSQYIGYAQNNASIPAMTGCNLLKFEPSLEIQPNTPLADEPVGLGVKIDVPQPEQPGITVTSHLRKAVVTLPEGMSVSPGVVDGVQACNESGPEGINFTGAESEVEVNGELRLAPGHCPEASIVGEAEAITPLLPEPVKGHVYLARPGCGGAGQHACTEQDALDGNLYKLYLELGGEGALANAGVNIKVPMNTQANPATGQLTTVVEENPQLPFSELKIRLKEGPRAPIANPPVCGPAVTDADFTPWSAPGLTPEGLLVPGTADATPSSFYTVTGCTSPPSFNPGFVAGTVTPQAGKFSAFTVNLSRQDREQYVNGIQVHTPPGLLGMISNVPLCEEPAADSGTCPEASKIGTTRVASGAGSHPFEIEGNIYLTGPHGGGPFGLSIVTHAVAGPFNLGLVVVRARIDVNPVDSTITVTTDETGPYAVPQIVFGVPLRLQRVTVNVDRPGFMFNPTSCKELQVTANVSGSQNTVAPVSSPFAVAGCKSLAFKPKFTASTSGHTSRAKGASLDARLSYPAGSVGAEANIARVKVSLPRHLPSRLSTLQHACTARVFERNPTACPSASVVGIVRARTPVLPVELSGPVYFVSHGGEQFPSLVIVLQGDGVRVDLTGATFINKQSITSTTFKAVPDVPVGTFELYLPEGKFSAVAATANLCKTQGKLTMPTEFVAQNGAVVKQNTKIAVTGCPKTKGRKVSKARKKIRASRAGAGSNVDRRAGR